MSRPSLTARSPVSTIIAFAQCPDCQLAIQVHTCNCLVQFIFLYLSQKIAGLSSRPRGLRRRSAAARLLRLWVRIPPGAWMFVCCQCCVLSGRGLCDGLITRPEESYRLGCVVVCDLETSRMRRPWPALGRSATGRKKIWKVVLLMFQDTVTMYSGPTNLTLKIKAARFSESAKGLRYDAFVYCRNTDRQTDRQTALRRVGFNSQAGICFPCNLFGRC